MSPKLPALATLLLMGSGCFLFGKGGSTGENGPWPGVLPPDGVAATQTGPHCFADAPSDAVHLPMEYPGEDFVFDDMGGLVTSVDWAGGTYSWVDDVWELVGPILSDELAGLDYALNGDLIIADEGNGALLAMKPNGGVETLVGSILSPNSLAVRYTGQVFSTEFDAILRVDPDTGEWTEIASFPGEDLDGLVFDPSGQTLYFNFDESGEVYKMTLDADGHEVETDRITTIDLDIGSNELNGMTMDACGNLYILRTDGRISRHTADGDKERNWYTVEGEVYTTGLHFGSGLGQWQKDHLYVMDRFGQLIDLDVGIDGAPEPHL